jgi:hypothetical protein
MPRWSTFITSWDSANCGAREASHPLTASASAFKRVPCWRRSTRATSVITSAPSPFIPPTSTASSPPAPFLVRRAKRFTCWMVFWKTTPSCARASIPPIPTALPNNYSDFVTCWAIASCRDCATSPTSSSIVLIREILRKVSGHSCTAVSISPCSVSNGTNWCGWRPACATG